MARYSLGVYCFIVMLLGDMENVEGGRLLRTEEMSRVRTVSAVRLVSARTIRTTLSLSKCESEWRLMHSTLRPSSALRPLSLPLTIPSLSLNSARPSDSPGLRTTSRKSSVPSDRDFTRVQTRLSKLSSGVSLTMRQTVLSEDKTLELLLEQEERAYLKVRLNHKRIPLEVTMRHTKGTCIAYISKTVPEPNEALHEEVHRKETFQISETGLRSKSDWLYIGFKCIEDARVLLSIRFGVNRNSNSHKGPLVPLDGLEDYRKDEVKRKILDQEVAEILKRRKEAFCARFSMQNFIYKNKSAAGQVRSHSKPVWDEEHRREVRERRQLYRGKRVQQALLSLQRPQMLLERKIKEEEITRENRVRISRERDWLTRIAAAKAISELWSRFEQRKVAIADLKRRVKAAIRLQMCFKRCILTLEPRQLVLMRALDTFNLYVGSTALTAYSQTGDFVVSVLRASWKSQFVKSRFDNFLRKGKDYVVVRIQWSWRDFQEMKQRWRESMVEMWDAEVRLGVKGKKRKKDEIVMLDTKGRNAEIGRYWEDYRKRFAGKWAEYQQLINENSFASDQQPPRPSFHPLPTKSELRLLVRHSQSFPIS